MKTQHIRLLSIGVLLGIIFFIGMKARYGLKKNPVFSHAVIKEIKSRYRDVGIVFSYSFICNGQEYTNSSLFKCSLSKIPALKTFFLDKQFPMVYNGEHCDNNRLLFDTKTIDEYNLQNQLTTNDNATIKVLDSIKNN